MRATKAKPSNADTAKEQRELLRAAHRHVLDHRTWPTRHWLAAELGLAAPQLRARLRALKRRGLVDYDAQGSHGVRLPGLRLGAVSFGGGEAAKRLMGELDPRDGRKRAQPKGEGDGEA